LKKINFIPSGKLLSMGSGKKQDLTPGMKKLFDFNQTININFNIIFMPVSFVKVTQKTRRF